MIRPEHLGARIAAVIDGELDHQDRDRALAHIAHCTTCRAALEEQRRIKQLLANAAAPPASPELTARLQALAAPGGVLRPRERGMPLAPLVPNLPPPGRRRHDFRRPPGRGGGRRLRYTAASMVAVVAVMLATAFLAGGAPSQPGSPVLPPAAELSVEHAATTSGLPLSDPAFDAVTASFGGLTFPEDPNR